MLRGAAGGVTREGMGRGEGREDGGWEDRDGCGGEEGWGRWEACWQGRGGLC